jgi:polyribonucleotide nucleotidyltransferase
MSKDIKKLKTTKKVVAKPVAKPVAVDLIDLANDTTGAWETQVFRGTVVSLAKAGTFVDFGASKDGLLRKKTYMGTDRKGKKVDVPFRVGAQIRVMISSIQLAKKLRETKVGLRVAPQCRCCGGFGHVQKQCKERGAFGQRTKVAAKAVPAVVCQVVKSVAKPKNLGENLNLLSVAVVGDLSKLTVEAEPASTITEPAMKPLMSRLFAAPQPSAAKPVTLDYASAVLKSEPQVQAKKVEAKEQAEVQVMDLVQNTVSKSARRRQRAKKIKVLKCAEASLVSAPPADKENQPSLQQCNKPSNVESSFDTMMSELDLMLST